MPQLTTPSTSQTVAESRSRRSVILIGGTLVVLVAGGISMQVWRAQATQAAEQKSDGAADSARTDAQNTAFARVNAEPISYEALATRIGKPTAQRAVGLANGRNRIPIVVPCHRVIQKNGQLRGYGGGLWRKQFLLDLEVRRAGLVLALGG